MVALCADVMETAMVVQSVERLVDSWDHTMDLMLREKAAFQSVELKAATMAGSSEAMMAPPMGVQILALMAY